MNSLTDEQLASLLRGDKEAPKGKGKEVNFDKAQALKETRLRNLALAREKRKETQKEAIRAELMAITQEQSRIENDEKAQLKAEREAFLAEKKRLEEERLAIQEEKKAVEAAKKAKTMENDITDLPEPVQPRRRRVNDHREYNEAVRQILDVKKTKEPVLEYVW